MSQSHAAEHVHHELGFWRKYVFSTDHKIIAIQYLITAMTMAVIGGILSMLMRYQLAWPSMLSPTLGKLIPDAFAGGVMKPEFYVSLVTMHGTIMVFFLFTAVLTGGFGNFLIPLQIGARDMAFPFLNALSYWVFLLSCIVIFSALFVAGGAPLGGWTAYAPLSAVPEAGPGQGMGLTLWITAIALFTVSGLMGGLNYITTILTMRTRGLSMMRLPLTQWSLLITAILGLLAFPVLLAAAILLIFDRAGGTSFFIPAGIIMNQMPIDHSGGHPLLWQHLFWFFGHPEVYIVVLPAMGMASDILSTFCRKPIFSYSMMVYSLVAIAVLSFIVWGHHFFVRILKTMIGKFHFMLCFIGVYSVFFPMHIIGIGGQMLSIYDPTQYMFLVPQQPVNVFITIAAFILGSAQLIVLFNFFFSIFAGKRAVEHNPWHATTLEWTAPNPPGHGNFGEELPTVYRWPFDYSVPGEKEDFVPQTVPATVVAK